MEFQTLFPDLTNIMDSVYRGGMGGGSTWGAEGGIFHTFEQRNSLVYSLKCTNSHSSLVRLIQLLVAVLYTVPSVALLVCPSGTVDSMHSKLS